MPGDRDGVDSTMRGLLQRGPEDLDRQVDRDPRLPVHPPMERYGNKLARIRYGRPVQALYEQR
jgi:hypothetical protein